MRWDVGIWAGAALLLFAAEALVPGAFMLWLGIAAAVLFLIVLLVPAVPMLAQIALFVVLSFVAILVYRRWFRGGERTSDRPTLNRRADALVGQVAFLEQAIAEGQGRVQIADAFWNVSGPELPAGTQVRVIGADGMVLRVEPIRQVSHS